MARKSKADVIVVGLGPVGAYVAWQAASRGLDVIGLESKPEGLEPSGIGAFHFERIAFDRTGMPLPDDETYICKYPGMTVHAPDPDIAIQVDGVETWALELSPFIKKLRAMAKAEGARLKYGVKAGNVIRKAGRVTGVEVGTKSGSTTYNAQVVIDATGLARMIRKQLPQFRFNGDDLNFSVYMEYWQNPNPPLDKGLHSYAGPNAWIAEYPDYWIVGMGQPGPLQATRSAHAAWVKRHKLGDKAIIKSVTGAIPYSYPPPSLVDDGVIIVGDAAATNKPFSGEGIASGMMLAKIAADILPDAIKAGGSRSDLWPINVEYFTDQGAKFAFLRAMGLEMIKLNENELNKAFEIGLIKGRDLKQTFIDYEVQRPINEWILPSARLAMRPLLARKFAAAVTKAAQIGSLFKSYPPVGNFHVWERRFKRLVKA